MGPDAMNRCAVLGAGSWGTTLALHLDRLGVSTALWEFDGQRAARVAASRLSLPFLPGRRLPDTIAVTADLAAALRDADVVVLAVPSHALRDVGRSIAPRAPHREALLWVSATKGFEEGTGKTPREVLSETVGLALERIVVLAGPSFAVEVAAQRPTAILAAAVDQDCARRVQRLFSCDHFRVYTSADPLGVEIGVSLKNVIAIAAGLAAGLSLGANALGALVTRGLAEIARLGERMGARPETFLGLAGIGDLVMTCTSPLSRNYRVGLALARGSSLAQILDELQMVAEGVRTCRSACELGRHLGVELPITDQVHAVLFEGKPPREAVLDLMRRPLKAESRE